MNAKSAKNILEILGYILIMFRRGLNLTDAVKFEQKLLFCLFLVKPKFLFMSMSILIKSGI